MLPERSSNQGWWSTRLMWCQGNIRRGGWDKAAALMEHISPNISLLQSSSVFFCPFSQYSLKIPLPANLWAWRSHPLQIPWQQKAALRKIPVTIRLPLQPFGPSGLAPFKKHGIGCTCCIIHGQQLIGVFLPDVSQKLRNVKQKIYKDHSIHGLGFHWGPKFFIFLSRQFLDIPQQPAPFSVFQSFRGFHCIVVVSFNNILVYFLIVLILL